MNGAIVQALIALCISAVAHSWPFVESPVLNPSSFADFKSNAWWERLASKLDGSPSRDGDAPAADISAHPFDGSHVTDDASGGHAIPDIDHFIAAINGWQLNQWMAGSGHLSPPSGSGQPSPVVMTAGSHVAAQPKRKPVPYCSPPNPCPKGKTAATDGCQENVPDTEEFNRLYILRQMEKGVCPCDKEHNNDENCPTTKEYKATYGGGNVDWREVDALLSQASSGGSGELKVSSNPQSAGQSDQKRVQFYDDEHSGSHYGSIRQDSEQLHASESSNPYLEGDSLPRAAKKSPNFA